MEVIDKGGEGNDGAEAGAEGADDANENAAAAAGDDTESQQADDAGGDGAGGAEAPGADGEETGGEAGSEDENAESAEGGAKPEPLNALAEKLEKRFQQLEEKFLGEKAEQRPKAMSTEQWAELTERTGATREMHQHVADLVRAGVNAVRKEFQELVGKEVGPLGVERAIASVAGMKGFTDAKTHMPEIQAYLAKYRPEDRRNPDLIKDAVIYARGLKVSATRKQSQAGQERNRRVGVNRPASPNGKGGKGIVLNAAQKKAARSLPGGEAEYMSLLKKKGTGPMQFDA